MRRREFIAVLGGAVTLPLAARAQQAAMPVVGFLWSASFAGVTHLTSAFRRGLKEIGFVEGQNVAVEYRFANNRTDQLPALTAELIRREAAVIAGNAVAMLPTKAATTTIPIVFTSGGDPIRLGLVTSLNRPGGNVTGVVFFGNLLGAKRLELLRQLLPTAGTFAVLMHPNSPNTEAERGDVRAAAQVIGRQLVAIDIDSENEFEAAFATFAGRDARALLVGSGAFLNSHRERIVALAARHALPAIYHVREAVVAGGLMSYGPSITDAYRQAGIYAGRILKGEKPADLPVMRSTKFEFVLNLKTAKALGLEIPPTLLALADEVIE